MTEQRLSLPIAVPGGGEDLASHAELFRGNIEVHWSPETSLEISLTDDAVISRLYAPLKNAMRFLPAGSTFAEEAVEEDSLLLKTWPIGFTELRARFPSPLPAVIRIANVDPLSIREAAAAIYEAQREGSSSAVDAFMEGKGLLLTEGKTFIGKAAHSETTSRREVTFSLYDSQGNEINPVQFFADLSIELAIDPSIHPLLANLALDGWVEILALDAAGEPLTEEPYEFHVENELREGMTDSQGRIYQENVSGPWAVRLKNHPSFSLQEASGG